MKTSDKIMTTLIIVAIFAAGGYFLYKHFVLDKEIYSLEDVEGIETVDIWSGDPYAYESSIASMISVCDVLETSDANYFTMSYEYEDGWETATITQTDTRFFSSIEPMAMSCSEALVIEVRVSPNVSAATLFNEVSPL